MATNVVDSDDAPSEIAESHITGKFITESEVIKTKEYFDEFQNEVEKFLSDTKGLSSKHNVLTEPGMLCYEGEPKPTDFKPNKYFKCYINEHKKNITKTVVIEELASVRNRRQWSDLKQTVPKYALYEFKPRTFNVNTNISRSPGILFEIKVYKPYTSNGRKEDVKIQQEIWIKGNQTLKQLKDTLVCHLDYCGLEDVSCRNTEVWHASRPTVKDGAMKFPAYFFFIHPTFYTFGQDMSECVRPFLQRQRIGTFIKGDINTRLIDIELQIGRPYVYQHLGQCEHVFIVSDIRIQDSFDPVSRNYPFVNAVSNSLGRQCMLCGTMYAHWLVTNFAQLTLSRAYLCHRCFKSYCYVDSRKAGEFQAYQYFDPTSYL